MKLSINSRGLHSQNAKRSTALELMCIPEWDYRSLPWPRGSRGSANETVMYILFCIDIGIGSNLVTRIFFNCLPAGLFLEYYQNKHFKTTKKIKSRRNAKNNWSFGITKYSKKWSICSSGVIFKGILFKFSDIPCCDTNLSAHSLYCNHTTLSWVMALAWVETDKVKFARFDSFRSHNSRQGRAIPIKRRGR